MRLDDHILVNGVRIRRDAFLALALYAPELGVYDIPVGAMVYDVTAEGRALYRLADAVVGSCLPQVPRKEGVPEEVRAETFERSRDALIACVFDGGIVVDPMSPLSDVVDHMTPAQVQSIIDAHRELHTRQAPVAVVEEATETLWPERPKAPRKPKATQTVQEVVTEAFAMTDDDADALAEAMFAGLDAEAEERKQAAIQPVSSYEAVIPAPPRSAGMPYVDDELRMRMVHGGTVFWHPTISELHGVIAELKNRPPQRIKLMNTLVKDGVLVTSCTGDKGFYENLSGVGWTSEGMRWLFWLMFASKELKKPITPVQAVEMLEGNLSESIVNELMALGVQHTGPVPYTSRAAALMRSHSSWSALMTHTDNLLRRDAVTEALALIQLNDVTKQSMVADRLLAAMDKDPVAAKKMVHQLFTIAGKSEDAARFMIWSIENGRIGWNVLTNWLKGDRKAFQDWCRGSRTPYTAALPTLESWK